MINHTKMQDVKSLFFNESIKRWHFEEIIKDTGLSRERVSFFLKCLVKKKLIIRVKPKGKMPYYISNRDLPKFRSEKRMYGLKILEEAGLFSHISSLEGVKSGILFGSFSRGDWNKSSDIDLFVYGEIKEFEKGQMETKLGREIQIFSFKDTKKMKKELDPKLMPNIIKGFNIKGNLEPFEVTVNA